MAEKEEDITTESLQKEFAPMMRTVDALLIMLSMVIVLAANLKKNAEHLHLQCLRLLVQCLNEKKNNDIMISIIFMKKDLLTAMSLMRTLKYDIYYHNFNWNCIGYFTY